MSRVITVPQAAHSVLSTTSLENVAVPKVPGLPEDNDVSMDTSENISGVLTLGPTQSLENNDSKRAKYDDTVEQEAIPSTSCSETISKSESTHMEVAEEPVIIEVSLRSVVWVVPAVLIEYCNDA